MCLLSIMFSMVWCSMAYGWNECQPISGHGSITIHLFSHSCTMCTLVFHLSLSLNFAQIFSYIQPIIYAIPIERLSSTFTILVHKSRQKCLHSFCLLLTHSSTRSCYLPPLAHTHLFIHSAIHFHLRSSRCFISLSLSLYRSPVTQPSRYTLTCPFDTSLKINIAE